MYEYVGAIHIHSVYSDGTGRIPDIARAASEVGLDFIMMSDHNTLKAKKDGLEGWRDNVMVLIGYEINDRHDRNHYLAFGLDSTVGVRITAQEYVRRVKERGGVGFLAHPDEKRGHMPEHPPYPWTAWDSEDFDGIEIWNHMSEWMEGLTPDNKLQRFLHPLKSIVSPSTETLARWDALNRIRPVSGIGGVDAHAHKADVLGFFDVEVFPYKVMFRSIHTHVLLDEELRRNDAGFFEEDKWRIYEALRAGRSFIANSYHADPRGFDFHATAHRRKVYPGATLQHRPGESIKITARASERAELRLYCNGTLVHTVNGKEMQYRADVPGAYRAEAWLDGKGWIFSNHLRCGNSRGRC
ncbi:MAG: PHP domain-containing protein [Ignavibacteriae bacterium]|nr:PHP domain-containing protein [Ignavibacteriota bacterium]